MSFAKGESSILLIKMLLLTIRGLCMLAYTLSSTFLGIAVAVGIGMAGL